MKTVSFTHVINTEFFQTEMLKAFDALEIGESKAQRRLVLLEAFKLYKLEFPCRLYPVLYAQLEGILTDVLIETGFLKAERYQVCRCIIKLYRVS